MSPVFRSGRMASVRPMRWINPPAPKEASETLGPPGLSAPPRRSIIEQLGPPARAISAARTMPAEPCAEPCSGAANHRGAGRLGYVRQDLGQGSGTGARATSCKGPRKVAPTYSADPDANVRGTDAAANCPARQADVWLGQQDSARTAELGQAVPEFALVFPLLALLLFGTIQMGIIFGSNNGLINSVREAARFGSVCIGPPASCGPATQTYLTTQKIPGLGDRIQGHAGGEDRVSGLPGQRRTLEHTDAQ